MNDPSRNGAAAEHKPIYTESDLRNFLEQTNIAGNWFHFRRDYVTSGIMTKEEALFFQDLVNKLGLRDTIRSEDGYFLCTRQFLNDSLGWTKKEQERLFQSLTKKGFVKKRLAGVPARRWVYVDLVKAGEALKHRKIPVGPEADQLDGSQADQLDGPEVDHKEERIEEERIEEANPLPPSGASAPSGVRGIGGCARLLKGQDTSRERQCAESLWQGLSARGQLRRLDLDTEETVRKWKTPFRALLRAYPMEEIEKTIQTHVSAVGERYWPVAYCAKEFCSKYDQIRRAMTRKNLSSIDSAEGRWEARIRKWEKMTGLSRSVLREREDGKLVNPLDGDGPWNVLLDDE